MALGKTLEEIELMPERHFSEYMLFYREQPFGLWREDYRTAQIAHILAMVNSDPNKKPPEIVDFMPFYKDKAAQTEDDGSERYLANR
ncbi:phage tail assembly protein T [Aggregatibacter aphrophilus]